ncbi:MAG: hypothetical protein P0Y53_18430 [Candidatus Pseudobacter hemicellulosilyticus]|uniref:Hemerythrin-like domain-containing protein n=1 Tax=Candidatus Pseudobacter hemicellulosilyticus TaxID=3121375 RepID=A0AAJ5WRP7_9BACT|nr:MAG: hypothetical protein P0Y53_18430 [Pseudobacter sp.]
MERAKALQSLSKWQEKDQQSCQRLLQGVRVQQDRKALKKDVLSFWNNELQQHMDTEEKILLPFLSQQHFNKDLINLVTREKQTIRLLAQRLPTHDDGVYLYEIFLNLVQQHLQFQNKVVLTKMEKEIPAPQLAQLKV